MQCNEGNNDCVPIIYRTFLAQIELRKSHERRKILHKDRKLEEGMEVVALLADSKNVFKGSPTVFLVSGYMLVLAYMHDRSL